MTTTALVVSIFYESAAKYGFPASVLSDNGAIFTASFRGDRGALSTELARLGIVFKHSRPYHPQTCGKVERFHQTLKKFLKRGDPPRSMTELQRRLDTFVSTTTPSGRTAPRSDDTRASLCGTGQGRTVGHACAKRRRVPDPPRSR